MSRSSSPRSGGEVAFRRRGACALGLALALVGGTARAGGETVGLEARGAYHGYGFDSDWSRYREHLFEESLRAEYSAFLIERTIASYNLGLTLGRADYLTENANLRYLRVDYDAFVDIWHDGLLPLKLYARRTTFDLGQDAAPAQHLVSQVMGYSAALVPREGPRLRSQGYLQDTRSESVDQTAFQRRWDLSGDVTHSSDRLSSRASVEREALLGDMVGQQRVVDTARVDATYDVLDTLSVSTQASSRGYLLMNTGEEYRAQADQASTHMRWTPSLRTLGTLSTQLSRRDYAGNRTSSERVAASFGIPSGERWSVMGTTGVESSSYEDADSDGPHAFLGEYANALVVRQVEGPHGSLRLEGNGGLAYFQEEEVGGGLQQGIAGRALATRTIAGPMFRLVGGGRLARQWDASPRDLDLSIWGWEAALEGRPAARLSFYVQADQLVTRQLSQEEGDSDRYTLYGTLRYALLRDLALEYGVSQHRVDLDGAYSGTLGHSLRTRVDLGRGATWSLSGYRYLYDNDQGAPWWWTRGESELRFERGLTTLLGRATIDLDSGNTAESTATSAYVELRRRWRWAR